MSSCPRIAEVVRLSAPQSTAYDRDQQALRDRVTALEQWMDVATDRLEALESCAVGTSGSLVDARRRIEQLEAEVARLKGPRTYKAESPYVQAIDQKLENIRNTTRLALGMDEAAYLPCGCPAPHCGGHQFDRSRVCAIGERYPFVQDHDLNVDTSPATAYPPLPDEGT